MPARRPPGDDGPSPFEEAMGDVRRIEPRDEVRPQPPRPSARRNEDDNSVEFSIEREGESVRALAFGIDRKHLRRLSRGDIDYDRRVDLHGMDSATARRRLTDELKNASASGARCVLVVHGRGLHSEDGPVLKTALIEWLTSPPLAARILAFSSVPTADGGPGATAVLLRRSR